MMTKKDFIILAEYCIEAIQFGYVKKKEIDNFIRTMGKIGKARNNRFDFNKFEYYIKDRL